MSFFSSLFGGAVAQPIEAVGNVVDKLFTSDGEKLDKQAVLARLAQKPQLAQIELNKLEAQHRSVFVAGWRPSIGWVCAISLGAYYIPQYFMATFLWVKIVLAKGELVPYPVSGDGLMELVIAMLGLGLYRSVEKGVGRAK